MGASLLIYLCFSVVMWGPGARTTHRCGHLPGFGNWGGSSQLRRVVRGAYTLNGLGSS